LQRQSRGSTSIDLASHRPPQLTDPKQSIISGRVLVKASQDLQYEFGLLRHMPTKTALISVCACLLTVYIDALNPNLKFFSVWELESVKPAQALGWTNFLFTAGHLSQLQEWSDDGVGPSLLYVYDVFFSNSMLRPDYEQRWGQTFLALEPFLKSRAVMGVFLGDELAWSCIPFSNISAAADLVRLSLPRGQGIIYYNEAYPPFVPDGQAAWKAACPDVHPLTYPMVPSSLDWISIDYYPDEGVVNNNTTFHSKPNPQTPNPNRHG